MHPTIVNIPSSSSVNTLDNYFKPKNNMTTNNSKIRFVCISDTHGKINFSIPKGDILIHSGDLTKKSSLDEYLKTIQWLGSLPHRLKIVIAGNHDHALDECFGHIEHRQTILSLMEHHGLIYLEHELFTLPPSLGGYTLFGSPYSPIHLGGAFMLDDKGMSEIWNDIPSGVDILVTHTPPYGFCDRIMYRQKQHVGCKYLRQKIEDVIKPKVSIFGHIHEAHGSVVDKATGRLYINGSLCDYRYRANQTPITFDIPKK
ncbi:Metallo-dependent phosphatase-like protein [Mycotypha africana]|uniref:Metallo-dependent phosphatase-like protein n=1 Tax=Mycotypha africana TaxID=64632 RepID=UPI002300D90C|nr:Metallo-dependent phosphatase-like protein [Mycotypha africana]KAI8987374.1 Metallo-dependent phosphatase-like protein [Mycotypha africana]